MTWRQVAEVGVGKVLAQNVTAPEGKFMIGGTNKYPKHARQPFATSSYECKHLAYIPIGREKTPHDIRNRPKRTLVSPHFFSPALSGYDITPSANNSRKQQPPTTSRHGPTRVTYLLGAGHGRVLLSEGHGLSTHVASHGRRHAVRRLDEGGRGSYKAVGHLHLLHALLAQLLLQPLAEVYSVGMEEGRICGKVWERQRVYAAGEEGTMDDRTRARGAAVFA